MQKRSPARLAGAAAAAVALVAAAGAATTKWTLLPAVPVPVGATNSQLKDITAIAGTDVWAAGTWWDASEVHPLAAHWDGVAWKTADLPSLRPNTYLSGVDAVGAADVWAVGSTLDTVAPSSPPSPSLLHYDGSVWQAVPPPPFPAGTGNDLEGLDMRTATDGWAVGSTTSGSTSQPLILHWQGGKWSSSGGALGPGGLVSVAAAAADDVWAVGTQTSLAGAANGIVLHFDGLAWSPVKLAMPIGTTLNAVAVTGPGDVWVAGTSCGVSCAAVVWHRTAAGWQQVPMAGGTSITTLVAFTPANLWALGYQQLPNRLKQDHVEHWDGKQFTAEDTGLPPLPSSPNNQGELGGATPIFAAAGNPEKGDIYAVGWSDPPREAPRVIERD